MQKDITHLHAFIGYCPVLFALPALHEINNSPVIETLFSSQRLSEGESYHGAQVMATLIFIRLAVQSSAGGSFFYFEAIHGKHRFTTAFHQGAGQLYNRLYNRVPGNVFLKGNLFKQVQIAYALARKICLITVERQGLYNLFPTDLHGMVTNGYYIISLRNGGMACEQVMQTKRIVLSEMHSSAYRQVYGLGKNHMQPMKDITTFPFGAETSNFFHLPLPKERTAYRELVLKDVYGAGIHNLLLFKIVNEQCCERQLQTLVHLHNVYATWRQKNGLSGNYLLR